MQKVPALRAPCNLLNRACAIPDRYDQREFVTRVIIDSTLSMLSCIDRSLDRLPWRDPSAAVDVVLLKNLDDLRNYVPRGG